MGGYGSTRWGWQRTRIDTDGLLFLDVRYLARNCYLQPGAYSIVWTRRGQTSGNIVVRMTADDLETLMLDYQTRRSGEEWKPVHERVALTRTACHYGGSRPWFLCPGCGSQRAVLYSVGGRFRCRTCHELAYSSTRETPADRKIRRGAAIQQKLGGRGSGGVWPSSPKPKGMHWRTCARLLAEFQHYEFRAHLELTAAFDQLIARFDQNWGHLLED
jgi:hypothetical protein